MESKNVKVLGNGRRVLVDLKRKRTPHSDTYINRTNRKISSKRATSISPTNMVVKRRKLDGPKNNFGTSLLKNYSNFTRSGIPQRLMFYQNGEWNDFPRDFATLVKKDMQVKKAAIEVEYNGHKFILDFLHMVRLDSVTGYQQSLAWIDEFGKCFFPETFSGDERESNPTAYQDIRLQLEIEVRESNHSKFNRYSGDLEVEDSCTKPSEFGESKKREKDDVPGIEYGDLDCDDVRKLFFMGMSSSTGADIVELYRGSSPLMQARLELFYKQIEITNKYRGSANVRYAWFSTTKEALSSILTYGHIETSETKYGVGVHLSPANCTFNSAISCDIDENGVRHMVFCRVIMGNMELVKEGSKEFHPSGEGFDSGVDDLKSPSHYIVWNMNKNTHIYPEYAVSFKISSDTAGLVAKNVNKLDLSGVTARSPEPPIHSQFATSPTPLEQASCNMGQWECNRYRVPVEKVQEKVSSLGPTITRGPKSPWVALPTLLAALSENVTSEKMKLLQSDYELLKSKKIIRQDFISKLRLIVGDTLLRSAISSFYSKEKGSGSNESEKFVEKTEVAADKVIPEFGSNPVV